MMKFLPKRGAKGAAAGPDEMTLIGHLAELRTRLIRSVIAVALGAIVIWIFRNQLFDVLTQPYCDIRPEDDCALLVTSPLDEFNTALTLSGYGGLIVAMPVIIYQLGKFILPGLYPNEKKALIPFVAVAVVLLFAGIIVAYLFMPRALAVLTDILGAENRTEAFFTPTAYLGFFIKMMLAFGLAFELPLILVFLQLVGVLQTETLRKNRRIAAVAVVILSAVITPTGDPLTLLVLALPMYLFYEVAMIIGGRLTKNRGVVV